MTATNDDTLRRSYEQWRDAAPPKPLPGNHPSSDELDRLRKYGTARKEWLMRLEENDRSQITLWDRETSRKRKEEARRHHADAKKAVIDLQKEQRDSSICRHWANTGTCLYADACKFRHPKAMSQNQDKNNKSTKNAHRSRTRANRTNDNRMGAFRRFLLDTYGEERLKSGSGVVEVASGIHGGISFELVNLNGIPCTAIEPRGPLRLTKRRRMLQNGIYHRTIPLQKYNSIGLDDLLVEMNGDSGHNDQSTVGKAPRHWRLFFGSWMVASNSGDRHKRLARSAKKAAALVGPAATTSGHEDDYCAGQEDSDSDSDVDDQESSFPVSRNALLCQPCGIGEAQAPPPATEIESTLLAASIIIGLHPDQPTGDIVDMALKLNKAFAVAPCCVFPKIFDQRTLPCGTPVRSYEQFIEWIMSKNLLIRKKDLGFGGRSVVMYYDPSWRKDNSNA